MAEPAKSGGVQSVGRVLDLLEIVGDAGGEIGLSELAARPACRCPRSTGWCARWSTAATCASCRTGATRSAPGWSGSARSAGTMLGAWAQPRAAPTWSTRSARPRTWPCSTATPSCTSARCPRGTRCGCSPRSGRRVLPHCTGVGKALLSQLPDDAVRELLARTGMPAQTAEHDHRPRRAARRAGRIRREGYAIDEGEQEIGVRCVAVPVHGALGTLGDLGLRAGAADDPGADRPRRPPAPQGRRAAVVGDRRALHAPDRAHRPPLHATTRSGFTRACHHDPAPRATHRRGRSRRHALGTIDPLTCPAARPYRTHYPHRGSFLPQMTTGSPDDEHEPPGRGEPASDAQLPSSCAPATPHRAGSSRCSRTARTPTSTPPATPPSTSPAT